MTPTAPNTVTNKVPELVAPAGNDEKLSTVLHYGADAVYLGLADFSLRAKAKNFEPQELGNAVKKIQDAGKRAYVTINIFPHNRDIANIEAHLRALKDIGPDAVIAADPGVFDAVREFAPDLPIHVSTQANVTNYRAARFWEKLGAKRIVLSRELTINEIKEIRDRVDLELECFVHGAVCISYSGRCYISKYLANRSANLGECTNSCRWRYALVEEKRPGEYLPVEENSRGAYLMASNDLCMVDHLDKLAEAGVDSFKIEGRMKGIGYLGMVVKTYREAVDKLADGTFAPSQERLKLLETVATRGYTTGMYFDEEKYSDSPQPLQNPKHDNFRMVGIVKNISSGKVRLFLKTTLRVGDNLEFIARRPAEMKFTVSEIIDLDGNRLEIAKNGDEVILPCACEPEINDLVRMQ